VGEEAASAVVAAYPTPLRLFRAYEAAITAAARAGGASAAAAPGAAARRLLAELPLAGGSRLGPAKSRAVYERLFEAGWDAVGGAGQ
jgi:hypothetical protein